MQTLRLKTGDTMRTSPFFGRSSIEEVDKKGMEGGFFNLFDDGKEIGRADLVIHHKAVVYPFGAKYPANSALTSTIELYDEADRGKGHGTALLEFLMQYAKRHGAQSYFASNVGNDEFFEKMFFRHTWQGRIWVRRL